MPAAAQISFWCIAEAAILVHSLTGADKGLAHAAREAGVEVVGDGEGA